MMVFNLDVPIPGANKTIRDCFIAELNHRTSIKNPLDVSNRRAVVSLILKAQKSCNLGAKTTYLAINYVDRYLSRKEFPKDKNIALVATACLSLAAKEMDSASFSIANLKEDDGFEQFDVMTVGRMELQVTGGFGWDLRSITPFAFLEFLVYYFSSTDQEHFSSLKSRASEILFRVQRKNENILEFKPSVIAASALFAAAFERYPEKFPAFQRDIRSCELVDKAELKKCYEAMRAARVVSSGANKKRSAVDGNDNGQDNKKRLV